MGKSRGWWGAVLCCALAAAANCVGDDANQKDAGPDGSTIDATPDVGLDAPNDGGVDANDASAPACNLGKQFGTPVLLGGALYFAGANDEGIWFLPGMTTAFLMSNRPDGGALGYGIFFGSRNDVDASFTSMQPSSLNSVGSGYGTQGPILTDDGKTIYFTTGITSTYAAWTATRASTSVDFQSNAAAPLAAPINDAGTENFPVWVTPDGGTLYFCSNRAGTRDIWTAHNTGTGFAPPTPLSAVNTSGSEVFIVLSGDELQAVLTRGTKLYYTKRATTADGFGTPAEITELTAFASPLAASWLSPDGCTVYFDAPTDAGGYHMYSATRGQ